MANTYDVGDLPRVVGTLADSAGTATDPSGTITAKYTDPSDNTTTLVFSVDAELVKSATGIYYMDIDIDEAGTWHYRFESGTGLGQSAVEGHLLVRNSNF